MKKLSLTIRDMTKMGMLIAMTIILDVVFKIFQQANGGSINLAMVGFVLIAISFNWWRTWLAISVIFGLVSSLIDGYVAYYLFDYFFALSGFIVISLFNQKILNEKTTLGFAYLTMTFMLSALWRFMFHTISGVLYFETDWIGSMVYNAGYLFPSFVLSYLVMSGLYFSGLSKIIKRFQYN
jgi:thiamine transporter